MEKEKKAPRGFYVEKGSFFVHAAVVVLAVAMVIRLLGSFTMWNDSFVLATQVLLPLICSVLFIVLILVFGRIALWTTILPVFGGAAFFILSATSREDKLAMVICIVLALVAAFIYTATLCGMIRTKWILAVAFAGILAYQIAVIAVPAFSDTAEPVSFSAGVEILSSVGMMLSMLLASLAIKRAKPAKQEVELPRIKDPKPVMPKAEDETENTAEIAAEKTAEPIAEKPAADTADETARTEVSEENTDGTTVPQKEENGED